MKGSFYNENDPKAAAWLRELIKAGLIPAGVVDERSIVDVQPYDLDGYTQCHFFAGIGGWAYALKLAHWPEDRPIWTLSCPCQPLSCGGKRKGHADERHLWPAVYNLFAECRPPEAFGEQVASTDGREWFAGVRADLEGAGYACGGAIMPAASVGAPHRRERIFFVGHTESGLRQQHHEKERQLCEPHETGTGNGNAPLLMAHSEREGLEGRTTRNTQKDGHGAIEARHAGPSDGNAGHWSNCDIIPCRDGKARRIESGTFPLAHGIPGRVGLLRGYGNAIVPEVAAEFIKAFLETKQLA